MIRTVTAAITFVSPGGPEGDDHALVVRCVAGVVVRVGVKQPAVPANDEDRSLGTPRIFVSDAERASDGEVGVASERERNAESACKLSVALEAIAADRHHLGAQSREIGVIVDEGHEFARAKRCRVFLVENDDDRAAASELGERDSSGHGREREVGGNLPYGNHGGDVAQRFLRE